MQTYYDVISHRYLMEMLPASKAIIRNTLLLQGWARWGWFHVVASDLHDPRNAPPIVTPLPADLARALGRRSDEFETARSGAPGRWRRVRRGIDRLPGCMGAARGFSGWLLGYSRISRKVIFQGTVHWSILPRGLGPALVICRTRSGSNQLPSQSNRTEIRTPARMALISPLENRKLGRKKSDVSQTPISILSRAAACGQIRVLLVDLNNGRS
jgi:hypothetical protein